MTLRIRLCMQIRACSRLECFLEGDCDRMK
jgi:hypothetical protein